MHSWKLPSEYTSTKEELCHLKIERASVFTCRGIGMFVWYSCFIQFTSALLRSVSSLRAPVGSVLENFLLYTRYCIKCTFRSDFVLFAALFSYSVLLLMFMGFISRPAGTVCTACGLLQARNIFVALLICLKEMAGQSVWIGWPLLSFI